MRRLIGPGGVADERGGWRVTWTVPSAPGKRERLEGVTVAQAEAGPTTATVNWSTTVPLFRTAISQPTAAPGVTASAPGRMTALSAIRLAS